MKIKLLHITKNIYYFIVPYFITLAYLVFLTSTYDKHELHLCMNSFHTVFLDQFFKYFTEFGGGYLPYIIIGGILIYRWRLGVYLAIVQLLGGLLSLVGKRWFNELRPLSYFQEYYPNITLPLIDGVKMYHHYSFPSGHTITIFALTFGLALTINKKGLNLLLFLVAALTAYSRVYLSQHFAIDILAGSVVGVFCAWILFPFYTNFNTYKKEHG